MTITQAPHFHVAAPSLALAIPSGPCCPRPSRPQAPHWPPPPPAGFRPSGLGPAPHSAPRSALLFPTSAPCPFGFVFGDSFTEM